MRNYIIGALLLGAWLGGAALEARAEAAAFVPSEKEEYRFDTGLLRGTLRPGGQSRGLARVIHVPSGTRLDGMFGLLSPYRVFTTNHRYGNAAWGWPSTSTLLPDGAVRVRWPAGEDRPFRLTAVYRWAGAETLDLETTVAAEGDLPGFEVFLASYFHKDFPASCVYASGPAGQEKDPRFLATPRARGHWQMFPRHADLVPLIEDGRWRQPPHPVTWSIRERLTAPMAMRPHRESVLAAVLMAPPDDCFAVATPYEGEGHFSVYLSLFGCGVKAGETKTARSRLVVLSSPSTEQVIAHYETYLARLRDAQPSQ
jgi:hypothetical protein